VIPNSFVIHSVKVYIQNIADTAHLPQSHSSRRSEQTYDPRTALVFSSVMRVMRVSLRVGEFPLAPERTAQRCAEHHQIFNSQERHRKSGGLGYGADPSIKPSRVKFLKLHQKTFVCSILRALFADLNQTGICESIISSEDADQAAIIGSKVKFKSVTACNLASPCGVMRGRFPGNCVTSPCGTRRTVKAAFHGNSYCPKQARRSGY
jgi:hypothetical protein